MQSDGFIRDTLATGTVLNGKYEVEGRTGGGGFGIVYKARHIALGLDVAIKEYFPAELAVRHSGWVRAQTSGSSEFFERGRHKFLIEAQ